MNNLKDNLILWINKILGKKQKDFPLQYLMDVKGHKLPYVFKPAPKRGCPLLVVLHGNGNNKRPSQFISPEYNILMPLDQYGYKKNGCWFLGENGDFFIFELCKRLISEFRKRPEIKNDLYIWGSSMGGFASLLLGLTLEAHAVFCHIPQTNLYNAHWYLKNKTSIDLVFGQDNYSHPYRNLADLIKNHEGKFPLFFLSFNRFDRPFYNEENLNPLLEAMNSRNVNYALILHPQKGHSLHQKVADHVAWFSFYKHEIEDNYDCGGVGDINNNEFD